MQINNRADNYGWVAIALHWISAVFIIWLFLSGEAIEDAVGRAAHISAEGAHISLGAVAALFLLTRIFWRFTQRTPDKPAQHWSLNLLSTAVQWALLADIVFLVVSGFIAVWSTGGPIHVYSWFDLPSPLAHSRELHEWLEGAHGVAANLILPLVALHVLGALKHLIIDRDRIVQRMLWVRSRS